MFRRIVDGGIKKPVALASNHAQREIFVFDQVSAKVTFLSDSGRFITQISTKLKTDLTGIVDFSKMFPFCCSKLFCRKMDEKWTKNELKKAPDCKSLVYSSNELYLLDSPNNCIKIFAKGKQWSYFRSISPSGMHVSKFILTLL